MIDLDSMSDDDKLAALESIHKSIAESKELQKQKIAANVDLVLQALKKMESDIRARYDETGKTIEKRVASIKDGRDGRNGLDGKNGKDGRNGKDGLKGDKGDKGLDGIDGVDGVDGVSVTDAKIDFDGSLIITLSTGQEINVGEVVSPDLADKIQVISTMSTNGAVGIKDEGTSISTGVKNINFVGASVTASASGDDVTVNVSSGTGTVTSVAVSGGTTGLTTSGGPITTTGTITLAGTLAVANGGTGVTTSTGTTNVVLSNSPTLVTPALGTPSSATLTNATGLPIATGVSGLGTGVATFLATPSSANLASAVTDETGSGSLVFATSPTLVTPALGTPASGVVTNLTGTASININGTVGATTPAAGAFTTLSATGVTTVQAGTAALPAITTTGDTNTGIWFPAGDTIAFTEGGVESMRINSSGNMGIGTTSPQGRLNLSNAGAAGFEFFVNSPSAGVGTYIQSFNRSGGAYVETHYYAASHTFRTNASATTMVLDTSGNVGIGTASPAYKLDVAGAISTNNNLTFTGTGNRITGDFSNATVANRVAFETSTTNGNTLVEARPNGSGSTGSFRASNVNDPTNAGVMILSCNATESLLQASRYGTGTYLPMTFYTGGSERVRVDTSGNVGIGTSSPGAKLDVRGGNTLVSAQYGIANIYSTDAFAINKGGSLSFGGKYATDGSFQTFAAIAGRKEDAGDGGWAGYLQFVTGTTPTERARIDSSGKFMVGKTSTSFSDVGVLLSTTSNEFTVSGAKVMAINRRADDGALIEFFQETTGEGSISVSGTTVSYNGGHLSRWAQTTAPKDNTLLKGTVLSNLDEMNVYTDADRNSVDNEQLNKVKVSDVEGDANVAGVFVNWTHDDQHDVDEINMAMTGDMIIRIAQGTTVARGDLLMSAGDGTAKPQGDDIVRSKTVAKVTSTYVTCTYADGSYCVPCVLMAC